LPLQSICSYLQLLTMPTPSLILVPARFKTGKLYTPVATTSGGLVLGASGDFNVTRATTATRVNANGLIESVASGVPRLDYYTSGGTAGCPALLVEPSAQNLALHSRDLTNAVWSGTTVTTAKNAVGADGVASGATTITATAASGTVLQALSHASQSRVFSAYIRRVTGTGAIQLTTNGGTNWTTVTISSLYTQVACAAQTVASGTIGIRLAVSGDVIEVDFTQGEVGPVATSPITTTTTAPVTRNADVISVSGAVSGCIGQTEGTIYAEVDFRNLGYNGAIFTLQTDNWITNSIQIQKSLGNQWRFTIRAASAVILNVDAGTITAGIYKIALGYNTATSGTVLAVNGSILSTQTASSIPACNSVVLGTRSETGTNFTIHLNDRIRSLALYTTRLTNAELAALTTL
jgi:hypothetical protein